MDPGDATAPGPQLPASGLVAHQAVYRRHTCVALHLRLVLDLMTEPIQGTLGRLCIAGEHRRAENVSAQQTTQGREAIDVGTFVAVGGIATECQQGSADIVAGSDRRMRIAEVIAEEVAAYWQFIVRRQTQQMP